jgi:hypothetical protein
MNEVSEKRWNILHLHFDNVTDIYYIEKFQTMDHQNIIIFSEFSQD